MIARAERVDRGDEPQEELAGFLDRPTASQAIRDYRSALRREAE
jgi:hypothetical protein